MLLFLTLAVLRGDSPFPRKRGRSCFQVLFVLTIRQLTTILWLSLKNRTDFRVIINYEIVFIFLTHSIL